ncbi:MAG: 23S rRNA (pseudouridine(1915)-N(3))-methyltransferase RlmH [Burkholderiales bacterium]
MKIAVIAVGDRMPGWVKQGFLEYSKRMPNEAVVELIEVKPVKRSRGEPVERALALEAKRIDAHMRKFRPVVVLDERGEMWDTKKITAFLLDAMANGMHPAFVIGSADGLTGSIKNGAEFRVALSKMTLPHGLVRVILAEQLYRGISILQHHPYHRE